MQLSAAQKAQAAAEIEFHGVRIESLSLDFTLPGYPAIELIKDGGNISVTMDNVAMYVEKVIDMTLGSGVQRQVDAFKTGFSQVFPYSALRAFTPNELVMLFGRVEEDWTLESRSLLSGFEYLHANVTFQRFLIPSKQTTASIWTAKVFEIYFKL